MPINTDLNVAPFFDDYNANNEYYRILFRPSVPVQARELTQVQSILQDQVEKFGNWAFKNGDIVSGCTIIDIPVQPFVRLQDFQINAASFDVTAFVNTQVVSATSNLTARILSSTSGLVSNFPNTNVIYINYINTGINGETLFSNNETLTFYKIPRTGNVTADTIATVNTFANVTSFAVGANATAGYNTSGNAHALSVSDGVIFINGTFIKVLTPTIGIVNNFGTYAANNVVGFQLIESIVTENQDTSLLDNALGYPNENAPGAYRLKLVPTIISLDPATAANTAGFNPIATYNYGGLVNKEVAGGSVYSIVGDAIAQRIYDEAGNYVVNPFVVDTVTGLTGNSIVSSLSANNVLGRINPGVGYSQGQRIEILKTAYINMRRGVDTQTTKAQQITFSYGNYFVVNEVAGLFPFTGAQTVNLYDRVQQAVTNRTFSGTSPVGNLIGTASVKCFSYVSGIPGSNTASYYLHVFNIKMTTGFAVSQIKSIYYASAPYGIADVSSAGVIGSSLKDQLYKFGSAGIKNLRDASNNQNTQYTYRTANTTASMYANGVISLTIGPSAPGGTDILPFGVGPLAASDAASITVVAANSVDTNALVGTISVTNTSTNVVGTSTSFLTDFTPGDNIKIGSTIRTVANVVNSTALIVDSVFFPTLATQSGQTYYKTFQAGKIIPVLYNNGYINVVSSSVFTVYTGNSVAAGTSNTLQTAMAVDVYYDVLRTGVAPATKSINKNVYVKLNPASSIAGPTGPWCLGVSDITKLTAVYGYPDSSFSGTGTNLTTNFSFDSGQKDTHYDLGYLYNNGGYSPTAYPYLLVQLDCYTPNYTSGVGFFTVESYPVDDVNSANTVGVLTKDIPLYIDEAGTKIWLRDYVDFRPVGANTAAIANVVSSATTNPLTTLTFVTPSGGMNVPSYGKNLQSDFTAYLPRKDLIIVTPDNVIKVIEGLSSTAPQSPLFPDNAMSLAVLNIPPYPSLSSDQIDSDQGINQLSKTLIRDTSTAINVNLVTNRRYTMSDIGKLDTRISNLEYYTQLSLQQQKASNMTVTDANGLNRFKNGIFVETFQDFSLSDVANPEYSIAIDSKKGQARPKFVTERFKFKLNTSTSTNYQQTGRAITLPYTSVSFINQPYATKYRSSAHVASHWNGSMVLLPSFNNNIDTNNTASVSITLDNATPWQNFANSPFGSVWGNWSTSTTYANSSVINGTGSNTYNVELGYQYTQSTSQAALNNAIAQYQSQGYVIGGTSLTFTSSHGGIGSNASITQIS